MRVECSGARNRCEPRELNVERVGEPVSFSFPHCPKMPAAGGCERPGIGIIPFLVLGFHILRSSKSPNSVCEYETGVIWKQLQFLMFPYVCHVRHANEN